MGEFAAKFRPDIDLDEFERRLRAAAPGPQSRSDQSPQAPDPLAELARLVGGEGRGHDPFEALFRAQAAIADIHHAPERHAPDLRASHEPYFQDQAARPSNPQSQHPQSQDYQAQDYQADHYDHQAEANPFAAEPLPYDGGEPNWTGASPHAQEASGESSGLFLRPVGGLERRRSGMPADYAAAPAGRRKAVVLGMFGVIALGVAAIGGTLALRGHRGPHDVVTIQADPDPARIKPQPGRKIRRGHQPGPVQPHRQRRRRQGGRRRGATRGSRRGRQVRRVVGEPNVPDAPVPAPAAAAPAPQDTPFPTPRKVKTISVRADGSLIDGGDGRPARAAAGGLPSMASMPPSDLGSMTTGPHGGKAAKSTERVSKSTERVSTSATQRAQRSKPAKPASVASAAEPEIAGATGLYFVQLASSPVAADARSKANTLSVKFGSVLQGRHATFVEGKKGASTIYRVRVGHLTEASAKQMCSAIKGKGGDCYVAKN